MSTWYAAIEGIRMLSSGRFFFVGTKAEQLLQGSDFDFTHTP